MRTTVLETLGVMSGKVNRLDVLSDQEHTELTHLIEVDLYEVRKRLLQEGLSEQLTDRYIDQISEYRATAREHFRTYGSALDSLRHVVRNTISEVETLRKENGLPVG